MANAKPWVALACVCEHVLHEKDNVMSAIRIVDIFHVAPRPPDMPSTAKQRIDIQALVGVKAGDLSGPFTVQIVLCYPSGLRKELPPFPVTLKGGEQGHNVSMRLTVEVREYGLYWFDVLWEGEMLTRIPFKLVLAAPSAEPPSSS